MNRGSFPPPPREPSRVGGPVPARPDLPAPTRRRARWPVALLLFVSLAVGAVGVAIATSRGEGASVAAPIGSPASHPTPTSTPPHASPAPAPATPATSAAGDAHAFRFIARDPRRRPIRWDPCDPIAFTLDVRQAPSWAAGDAREAFRRLAGATELVFDEAPFDETPLHAVLDRMDARERGVPDLGADIVVVWMHHGRYEASRERLGMGRHSIAVDFTYLTRGGDGEIVGAVVIVDDHAASPPGFTGWWAHGPTVLHELGHAVGLGHVHDRDQIMYSGDRPRIATTRWGAGDLRGLQRVGRGDDDCVGTP